MGLPNLVSISVRRKSVQPWGVRQDDIDSHCKDWAAGVLLYRLEGSPSSKLMHHSSELGFAAPHHAQDKACEHLTKEPKLQRHEESLVATAQHLST